MEMPQIHRPIPRRHFEMTPSSAESSHPPSPNPEQVYPDILSDRKSETGLSPQPTRSILNLTSSTLSGIYSAASNEGTPQEGATPWGTGAQTPINGKSAAAFRPEEPDVRWTSGSSIPETTSHLKGYGTRGYSVRVAGQTLLLFTFGLGYGYLVHQLHISGNITPVPVHVGDHGSYYYLLLWGLLGVFLGNGLPLLDGFWNQEVEKQNQAGDVKSSSEEADSAVNPLWYSAVRSIGAFVGIAFAVRRVPWTSTLQVSLTLALANPVLWYLIDRSVTGFALSGFVAVAGTSALLLVNPGFVPVPAIHQDTASEQLGVYVWLASIIFCTSLCFGAVGRKLQL